MARRIVVSPRADRDIDQYAAYLETEAGRAVSKRFLLALLKIMNLIADQPTIGWPCRIADPEFRHTRVFRVPDFDKMLIFYEVSDDALEIVRLIHSSRNVEHVISNPTTS